jgi:MoxR-like ATPase
LEVFSTAIEDTLQAADKDDTAKAEVEAAITKARNAVMAYVHKVLDLVEQKVDALAKTQEAEALQAERHRLELRIQQEQEMYTLKQDILMDYKAQMQGKQAGFASVLEAEHEHKVCTLPCPTLSQ